MPQTMHSCYRPWLGIQYVGLPASLTPKQQQTATRERCERVLLAWGGRLRRQLSSAPGHLALPVQDCHVCTGEGQAERVKSEGKE